MFREGKLFLCVLSLRVHSLCVLSPCVCSDATSRQQRFTRWHGSPVPGGSVVARLTCSRMKAIFSVLAIAPNVST